MTRYASHVGTLATPQGSKIPGSTQKKNSAGGYGWRVDWWTRLDRFLILGNEGGSYYASERAMTVRAANAVRKCHEADPQRTIDRIVEISVAGRAPKNDPAIFALAMLSHDPRALKAMPQVCRIGTHLFQFVESATKFRRWGRALRRAVADWYLQKDAADIAYQITKYQNRNNWSHHDLLHQCHAKPKDQAQSACFRWAKNGQIIENAPELLSVVEQVKHANSDAEVAALIRKHRLAREVIPTERLNSVAVWEALLEHMPMTALLRNLGKMSSIGLLKPLSSASQVAVAKLSDAEILKKARVHPIAILLALYVYKSGRGIKGSLSWAPDSRIIDALDDAYYKAFDAVEPTGKRYLLALDVSGSMASGNVAGTPLTPRDASAAMAMVTLRTEPVTHTVGFTGGSGMWGYRLNGGTSEELTELALTKRQSLPSAIKAISGLPMGGTDCALPMLYAEKKNLEVDVFVVYTDSETWAGSIHPSQALQQYRRKSGIDSKLIVVGMVANNFTIADPNDAGMLDVVGFDASVPQVMADFAR